MLIFGAVVLERYYHPAVLIAASRSLELGAVPILMMTLIYTIIAIIIAHAFHVAIEAPMTRWLTGLSGLPKKPAPDTLGRSRQ